MGKDDEALAQLGLDGKEVSGIYDTTFQAITRTDADNLKSLESGAGHNGKDG